MYIQITEAVYTIGGQGPYDASTQAYPVTNICYAWSDSSLPHTPLTGGQIAGIVIGVIGFVVIVCCLVGVCVVVGVFVFRRVRNNGSNDMVKLNDEGL